MNAKDVLSYIRLIPVKVGISDIYIDGFFHGMSSMSNRQKIDWLNKKIAEEMSREMRLDINRLYSCGFVLQDDDEFGFLYTATDMRPEIDIWIQYEKFASNANQISLNNDTITFTYSDKPVASYKSSTSDIKICDRIYTVNRDRDERIVSIHRKFERLSAEEIYDNIKLQYDEGQNPIHIINMDNKLVENISLSGDSFKDARFVIHAENTVFVGNTAFENMTFNVSYFDGAVFLNAGKQYNNTKNDSSLISDEGYVSFAKSIFENPASDTPNPVFRNSHIITNKMVFDQILINNGEITFEDARISSVGKDDCVISFNGASLSKTTLNFFQTIAPCVKIAFLAVDISNGKLNFELSKIKHLCFLGINNFPCADFRFIWCERLELLDCELTQVIKFTFDDKRSVEKISLAKSTNSGCSILMPPRQDKSFPLIDSIKRAHQTKDKRDSLAGQLQIVKEIFHNMGNYEYEDATWVAYKNASSSWPLGENFNFLNIVGRYGTSPTSIVRFMFVLFFAFCTFNALLIICPADISQWLLVIYATGLAMATFSFPDTIMQVSVIQPELIGITGLIEGIVQWFILGYLIIAFTRKTLR